MVNQVAANTKKHLIEFTDGDQVCKAVLTFELFRLYSVVQKTL